MSVHPNVILMAVLKPNATSRATMRAIMADHPDSEYGFKIGKLHCKGIVMESNYHDGLQLAADEGDLVFYGFATYGYGETVEWSTLEGMKADLEAWAFAACEKHGCSHKLVITANYW